MRAILKTEGTKKFIENEIKCFLGGYVKVLKRNPGHITNVGGSGNNAVRRKNY